MAKIPVLKDDCFALPAGVNWTPVKDALAHLRGAVNVAVSVESISTITAGDRVLASDAITMRSNPPYANAAVDGYGFAFAAIADALPLVTGRSAAGAPYDGSVPAGFAIRILTGAKLPIGVDTIVMQEDVMLKEGKVFFRRGLKAGANCRKAGEDVHKGQPAVKAATTIGPTEIALMAALNIPVIEVYKKLRVGVLSTGAEIRQLGELAEPHQIYDANRPMLMEMLKKWGLEAIDLGHAKDDRNAIVSALDAAANRCDAILTSGGASAGDEDHLSAALNDTGNLSLWRIAIKPGRPLALGIWNGVPVFGLPGNPVAAFVTALVFAHPTLLKMQGAGWRLPRPVMLPAAFDKTKKSGRREYLRARINANGLVEKFASEGSGRISGLSWAEGLVVLPNEAMQIKAGDLVGYIPFSSFGI